MIRCVEHHLPETYICSNVIAGTRNRKVYIATCTTFHSDGSVHNVTTLDPWYVHQGTHLNLARLLA